MHKNKDFVLDPKFLSSQHGFHYSAMLFISLDLKLLLPIQNSYSRDIENTSWKVLAYGIYARVVDVSEIERVSAANE